MSFAKQRQKLRKIPKFHLICWCGNSLETHSFCRVSTKFPHQELGETAAFYALKAVFFSFYSFSLGTWREVLQVVTCESSCFRKYGKFRPENMHTFSIFYTSIEASTLFYSHIKCFGILFCRQMV